MNLMIRPLERKDLPEANRIFRLAFGTFLNVPDPMSFSGDAEVVQTRWLAAPGTVLGAYRFGSLVGSSFAANWGSFGVFGPLTVHPSLWDQDIGRRLLEANIELFEEWGVRQIGLFTFPDSPKHIALYQRFGFWPQYLTPLLCKSVTALTTPGWSRYSEIPVGERECCLSRCRSITDAVYPGLDLGSEIRSVALQDLGDTVLVYDGADLAGFAVCHLGAGSESTTGTAYVKFGAVRPGASAARYFSQLLLACEALAGAHGLTQLLAGVNSARRGAYQMMLERDFRTVFLGTAMQRPDEPGYNRPDCFVMDDWR